MKSLVVEIEKPNDQAAAIIADSRSRHESFVKGHDRPPGKNRAAWWGFVLSGARDVELHRRVSPDGRLVAGAASSMCRSSST